MTHRDWLGRCSRRSRPDAARHESLWRVLLIADNRDLRQPRQVQLVGHTDRVHLTIVSSICQGQRPLIGTRCLHCLNTLMSNQFRLMNRLLARHVGEPRQVQLVRDGHGLGWAVAVLGQNQVGLTATWVVSLEGIRPVQQDNHVGILFERVVD